MIGSDTEPDRVVATDIERRIQERVLDQYVPPGVVVDQRFDVLHSKGDVSRYVRLPEGDVSVNILAMVVAPLREELCQVLRRAERKRRTVRSYPIVFEANGDRETLTLIAIPMDAAGDDGRQTLVLFEARPIVATRDHLQTSVEEPEGPHEGPQSTDEERSTFEEELRVRSGELDHAKRDLEKVLKNAVSGVIVLDHELRVARYSAGSRDVVDLLPASIDKPSIAGGGTVDLAMLSNEIQRVLADRVPVERELELGERVFLVRLIPLDDDECADRGLLISFIEATEALRDARAARRLATVLKDSSDAITVQDRDGRILAWNRGAESMYGYTEAEALAMTSELVVPAGERDRWSDLVRRVYAGEPPAHIETRRRAKDGREIEVSVAVTALIDESGRPYALATTERNLTPIREMEARSREAEFAHEARLTTAGEMAAGLAHELNQPVTSIVHFCDVALAIARQFDRKRRDELIEVLTDATAQAKRAGDIIHNLRRFLGRREPVRSVQAINDIIEDTARLLHALCDESGVELELKLADDLPDVAVDKAQVSQVIVNLVRNSIDAMLEAGSEQRRVTIVSRLDDNLVHSVRVTTADTGPGVDHATAELLFEPFRTSKPNGLGMGLWMSRSIVESHGGRLWADEDAPTGAVFHFSLPTECAEDHDT